MVYLRIMKISGGFIRSFLLRWGPVLLWMALIFAFSADSDPYRMLPGWEEKCLSARLNGLCQDEMLGRVSHVLEYAVLAVLFSRAVTWDSAPQRALLALAVGLSAAYALLDEVHQLFVPGRTFQFFDLGLDLGGVLLGVVLYGLVKRRQRGLLPGSNPERLHSH